LVKAVQPSVVLGPAAFAASTPTTSVPWKLAGVGAGPKLAVPYS
jgi:hypothetical protein